MKISDGLLLQKDLAEEIARLRQLGKSETWEYRMISREHPDAKWVPTFDLEENHKKVRELTRLHRNIGRAISRTNNTVELDGLNDSDYEGWL